MGLPKDFDSVLDVKYGLDPSLDALLIHFMSENHLEYTIDPMKNASGEQMRFMVALKEGEFYAPCSDWMFLMLLDQRLPDRLLDKYLEQWKRFLHLSRDFCADREMARRFIQLARHKFRMVLASPILMPSRLMKWFITIFMTQSGIDDPYLHIRRGLNRRAAEMVGSRDFDEMVHGSPVDIDVSGRTDDLRNRLDRLEIERLMRIATFTDHWNPEMFSLDGLRASGLAEEVREGTDLLDPMFELLGKDGEQRRRISSVPAQPGGRHPVRPQGGQGPASPGPPRGHGPEGGVLFRPSDLLGPGFRPGAGQGL